MPRFHNPLSTHFGISARVSFINTSMSTSVVSASDVVTFTALTLVSGKGVTAAQKAQQHVTNGANVGALIGAGVQRKALIGALVDQGMRDTAHALSVGNIRPAAALVTGKAGKAVSIMEINGKAPYSEWQRMGAALRQMVQTTNAGKPTAANKALVLFNQLTDMATAMRAEREAARTADKQAIAA